MKSHGGVFNVHTNAQGVLVYRPLEMVRAFFPRMTEDVANYVLWNMTAYPMAGCEGTCQQLAELAARVRPRKRGWLRRLWREARRIETDLIAKVD